MEGDYCSTTISSEKRKQRQQQEKPYREEDEDEVRDMSAASIRKKATEVGARVDALQTSSLHDHHASISQSKSSSRVSEPPDLNEFPNPESSDED
ncbi:ethylene-responsive transcription factor [Fagus crenata]